MCIANKSMKFVKEYAGIFSIILCCFGFFWWTAPRQSSIPTATTMLTGSSQHSMFYNYPANGLPNASLFAAQLTKLMQSESDERLKSLLQRIIFNYYHIISFFRLHRCHHLYIDLGSSTGMQFRKLYEPHLYPQSSVHKYFNDLFQRPEKPNSSILKHICSIGFEASPEHTNRLTRLQTYYQAKGYPMVVFTETAVSISSQANVTFYLDKGAPASWHEWGSSLHPWDQSHQMDRYFVRIPSIDIALLLHEIFSFWHHSLKSMNHNKEPSHLQPHVIMKMDLEGSELVVLPHLLIHGLLCRLDRLMIEWHPHLHLISDTELQAFKAIYQQFSQSSKQYNCSFTMIAMDDESYFQGKDPHPL